MDFDYDEFEKYNEYDEEMEDEYDYEPEETEGEIRVRPKKTAKKRVSRRSIFEMYEPSELESSHLTDQDNEIRVTDMPERFQVRRPACPVLASPFSLPAAFAARVGGHLWLPPDVAGVQRPSPSSLTTGPARLLGIWSPATSGGTDVP